MNDYFKKIFNELDDAQRSAVTSSGDFVSVRGGAGTGKSSVLCCNAAYVLERSDIKYDEILIFGGLPHSEKDIERQLHSLTGLNYSEPCAHSFVSFCNGMLKRYWYLIDGVKPYFKILDDFKRNVILQEIIENNGRRFWRYRDAPSEIGRFIELLKRNSVTVEDYDKIINGGSFGRHYEYIGNVYRRYSEILQKHGYFDVEDIVNFTIRLFEDKERSIVLNKWKKIFVDDFHNITPNCYKLLKTLTKDALFATGDESQQVLFGFRGDTVNNSIDILLKDYPGTETIQLNRNYRSGVSIIDAANRVYQAGGGDGNILYGREDFKGIITAAVEKSIVDEAFYIGRKMEYLVRHKTKEVPADSDGDNRYSYSDCAVLIRNLDEFGLFYKQALDCLKIPNHIDGTQIYYRELDYLLS
ncbi:ATP-dependent helicase, partial [bacterium]|nr:ATP-dependent helicase [bacterium]